MTLLKVLALACLAYSLLALWEVRMSPRLNREIYGFFGHSWSQHVRYGGYRPILFLNHGIWVPSCSRLACWPRLHFGVINSGTGLRGNGSWPRSGSWGC